MKGWFTMKNISRSAQLAAALLVITSMSISIRPSGAASAQVDQTTWIENEFLGAVSKPLEERTELLEALEQKLAEALSAGTLTKPDALRYKFLIQKELGRYQQACRNCDEYLETVKVIDTLQPTIVTFIKPQPLRTAAVHLTKYNINQKTF